MSANINVEGRNVRNHSLRVTQVATLQDCGRDSFDIRSRSGHRSYDVDGYKRQSVKRKIELSKDLDLPHTVSKVPTEAETIKIKQESVPMTCKSKQFLWPVDSKKDEQIDGATKKPKNVETNTIRISVPENIQKVVIEKGSKEMIVFL